jgi:uncharacterized protein (DUF1810 family)
MERAKARRLMRFVFPSFPVPSTSVFVTVNEARRYVATVYTIRFRCYFLCFVEMCAFRVFDLLGNVLEERTHVVNSALIRSCHATFCRSVPLLWHCNGLGLFEMTFRATNNLTLDTNCNIFRELEENG